MSSLLPGDRAAEALCLKVPQLLHEVGALHERHVSEVEVAQDLQEEADRVELDPLCIF